jgi:hypothetical protein
MDRTGNGQRSLPQKSPNPQNVHSAQQQTKLLTFWAQQVPNYYDPKSGRIHQSFLHTSSSAQMSSFPYRNFAYPVGYQPSSAPAASQISVPSTATTTNHPLSQSSTATTAHHPLPRAITSNHPLSQSSTATTAHHPLPRAITSNHPLSQSSTATTANHLLPQSSTTTLPTSSAQRYLSSPSGQAYLRPRLSSSDLTSTNSSVASSSGSAQHGLHIPPRLKEDGQHPITEQSSPPLNLPRQVFPAPNQPSAVKSVGIGDLLAKHEHRIATLEFENLSLRRSVTGILKVLRAVVAKLDQQTVSFGWIFTYFCHQISFSFFIFYSNRPMMVWTRVACTNPIWAQRTMRSLSERILLI